MKLRKHLPWREAPRDAGREVEQRRSGAAGCNARAAEAADAYRLSRPRLSRGAHGLAIGREADPKRRTVVLDTSGAVSRLHAEVALRDGELTLRDLSSHGTFVNEKKVAGETPLHRADVIRIGSPGAELHVVDLEDDGEARSRELNVFSMSFLDAITAGFGVVVLLFMIVSQTRMLDGRTVVDDRAGRGRRWELRVLTGQRNLVALRERLEAQVRDWTALLALRETLVTEVDATGNELDTIDGGLRGAARGDRAPARELAGAESAVGGARGLGARSRRRRQALCARSKDEGNRQYLTGLQMGGKHVAILVDTSTSMLDRTIVNVIRRRNMSPEQQRRAPKWQQAVNTVDWLTTQIAAGTNVQIIGFAEKATWLIPDSEGKWVTVNDGSELDAPAALRASHPARPDEPACRVQRAEAARAEARQHLSAHRRLADDGRRAADA